MVSIILYPDLQTEQTTVVQQPPSWLYPHLRVWGYHDVWAGNRRLDAELNQLVDHHLGPLDALEAQLARRPIPAP